MPRLTTIATCIIAILGAGASQPVTPATNHATFNGQRPTQNRNFVADRVRRPARRLLSQSIPLRRGNSVWFTPAQTNAVQRPPETLAVGNCNDSGPGSLREAMTTAVDGDVISLLNLSCNTITLTSGVIETPGVTLRGPGMDQLAIDGGGNDLIFHRNTGATPLIIERLTIRNGRTDHGYSGCIWSHDDVVINSSRITGCQSLPDEDATGYDMAHGAAIGTLGSLTLNHSIVTGNTAAGKSVLGAALLAYGDAYIDDSTISNNTGTAEEIIQASVTAGGNVTLTTSHVVDNTATGAVVYGTALSIYGDALINDSTISHNTGTAEIVAIGNVVVFGDTQISASTLADNTLTAQQYLASGGGVYANGYNGMTIEASTISNNRAVSAQGYALGGGISSRYLLSLAGTTIKDNRVEGYLGAYGGGIAVFDDIEIQTAVITGNTAVSNQGEARGGGLFAYGGGVSVKYALDLSNNEATSVQETAYGGGLQVTEGVALLVNATISGNRAHSEHRWSYGGGINAGDHFGDEYGNIVTIFSTISGNTATSNCDSCYILGGGVHAFGGIGAKYSTINDNAVISVVASVGTAQGGGLAAQSSNYVANADGRIIVMSSTISGNRAMGGEETDGYGYTGKGLGGGVFALDNNVQIDASTIAFNQASTTAGGVFANNVHDDYFNPVPSILRSSIVAKNTAPVDADISSYNPLEVDGEHSLVTIAGTTANLPVDTLVADPLLEPLADNGGLTLTHALSPGSPAIDAGSNVDGYTADQRGEPWLREWGAGPDIGAFELQPDPLVIFIDDFET